MRRPLLLLHVMHAGIFYSMPFHSIYWKNKIQVMTQYTPHEWKILTY